MPNAQAMRARIWSPRLSAGFVPQGAAAGEGYAWVDAYRSVDTRQDQGPCRVFKVDPIDGGIAGQFDLSASCGQAGRDRTSG